jgi:hypothetical protein
MFSYTGALVPRMAGNLVGCTLRKKHKHIWAGVNMRWTKFVLLCLHLALCIDPGYSLLPPAAITRFNKISDRIMLRSATENEEEQTSLTPRVNPETANIYLLPFVTTVTSFNFYELTSKAFHSSVELLSRNSWIPVDGGNLLADVITPAVNGPILTSISILLGTLTATTISSLYARQNQIRQSIVTELEEIQNLGVFVQSFPANHREHASSYLLRFVEQFEHDARTGEITPTSIRESSNMDRFLHLLNGMSQETMVGSDEAVSDNILAACYSSLSRIGNERSKMIATVQATFPLLHYTTLAVLAASVCLAFLVQTDRNLLFFLAAFQLKALWALLLGVFSLLAVVIYDLNTPFEGTYTVLRFSDHDLQRIKDHINDTFL